MRNRWLIALAAVGIHISIGSVYAWSVLTRPIMNEMGFSLSDTTWTFSLAILFLGMSAGLLGSRVEKMGPKKSGLIAMLFFGTGMFGTAVSVSASVTSLRFRHLSNISRITAALQRDLPLWGSDLPRSSQDR